MNTMIAYGDYDVSPEYYYLPDNSDLRMAIELAIKLGKPLLLTGEPGTGKTQLAHYIAWQLSNITDNGPAGMIPFSSKAFVFNTKTNSVAKDLFYDYDAVSHFHDKSGREPASFIHLKAMGLASLQTYGQKAAKEMYPTLLGVKNLDTLDEMPRNTVLLIDEIDKAPRDFSNDLLTEIECYEFYMSELNLTIQRSKHKEARILTIMTSNNEKTLPEPFLRRCLYYNIDFPTDASILVNILLLRLRPFLKEMNLEYDDSQLTLNYRQAIEFFLESRESALQKKPSISELIDWIKVLHLQNLLHDKWDIKKMSDKDKQMLNVSLSILLKNQRDLNLFRMQTRNETEEFIDQPR